MNTARSTPEVASPPKRKGRIKRFLLGAVLVFVAVAAAAQLAWTFSGSNQWQKVRERNGVTLYSMKTPGSNIEKFKAVWQIHSTLSRFTKFALDPDGENGAGLYDQKDIERRGDQLTWTKWKERFSPYLKPREFVIRNEFAQEPRTRTLIYDVTAAPDKIPPDACCVRVLLMTNHWRLTPLNNKGDIAVEWLVDMDIGGVVPYFLQNVVQPEGMMEFAPKVQRLLDQDIYKTAKYDWIREAQP